MSVLSITTAPPGSDEFVQGGQVHGDKDIGVDNQGGANGLVGDTHAAVSGASAHLGAIGGEPGDLLALGEAAVGDDLARKEDALPAKAGQKNIICHS